MQKTDRDILEHVKSGQYFIDARMWYARKYLYPVIERSALTILISFAGFLLVVVLANLKVVSDKEFRENFIVSLSSLTEKYATVKPLAEKSNDSYEKLITYLLESYVTNFESYRYQEINGKIQYVQNHSSKQLFRRYFNANKIDNQDSPILLYGKSTMRKIEVEKIHYKPGENYARVFFTSRIIGQHVQEQEVSRWVADIQFDLPNFEQMMGKNIKDKLDFIVIEYKSTKLI